MGCEGWVLQSFLLVEVNGKELKGKPYINKFALVKRGEKRDERYG